LLAVSNTHKCEHIPTDDIPNIKHIFVLLIVGNTKFILCCVYIPPNSPYHIYAQFCELVKNTIHLHPNTNILLIGDFNLSNFTSQDKELSHNPAINIIKNSSVNYLDLKQYNNVLNFRNETLDLIFSNLQINTV